MVEPYLGLLAVSNLIAGVVAVITRGFMEEVGARACARLLHRHRQSPDMPLWFHRRVQAEILHSAHGSNYQVFMVLVLGLGSAGLVLLLWEPHSYGLFLITASSGFLVVLFGALAWRNSEFKALLRLWKRRRDLQAQAIDTVQANLTGHEQLLVQQHRIHAS